MDRLTNMEAFVRVVNAGSFTAAAKSWGVSKAVVSKYVASLEAHLDVALLRRTTRASSLTDAGKAYYSHCVDILGEIEAVEASLADDNVQPRGHLRLTAPPGLMARYRSLFTTEFAARFPEVSLDIDLTHRLVDLVEEGFDVAIRVTVPEDSSLVARRLAPAPIVAVASPAYLKRRGTPRKPADLKQHDCLIDSNFRELGRWPFRQRGKVEVVEVRGPFRVNNPIEVCALAIAGHGIALTPAFVAEEALERADLVEVLAGSCALAWGVYAVYPRKRHLAGRVRAFIEHVAAGLTNPGGTRARSEDVRPGAGSELVYPWGP